MWKFLKELYRQLTLKFCWAVFASADKWKHQYLFKVFDSEKKAKKYVEEMQKTRQDLNYLYRISIYEVE